MSKKTGPSWFRRIDRSGMPLLIARLLLGGLFIWLGAKKVGDPVAFLKQVHLYGMLPESPGFYLNATAIIMPWFEIVGGVALLLGILLRGSGLLLAAMLAAFTPAIFLRALEIMSNDGTPFFQIAFDCGCGSGEVIIWKKLLENSGLFLLAVFVIASRSRRFCLQLWLDGRRESPQYCRACGYLVAPGGPPACAFCDNEQRAFAVTAPDASVG